MVVRLVLRANVGDYQPKGLSSCWTAQSPRGDDALERSLNQMRGKMQCLPPEEIQQEWIFFLSNGDYRHQQNPHLLLVISP